MPPPPPYPGPGAGYESQRQHMAVGQSPWSASVPSATGVAVESHPSVPGIASFPAAQNRAPVGQTVQDGVASRLPLPHPEPKPVSPTKRIALESKTTLPAVTQANKDSPFFLVCFSVKASLCYEGALPVWKHYSQP